VFGNLLKNTIPILFKFSRSAHKNWLRWENYAEVHADGAFLGKFWGNFAQEHEFDSGRGKSVRARRCQKIPSKNLRILFQKPLSFVIIGIDKKTRGTEALYVLQEGFGGRNGRNFGVRPQNEGDKVNWGQRGRCDHARTSFNERKRGRTA
jgi:hypothetical protein